jgi:hypothetical protein
MPKADIIGTNIIAAPTPPSEKINAATNEIPKIK